MKMDLCAACKNMLPIDYEGAIARAEKCEVDSDSVRNGRVTFFQMPTLTANGETVMRPGYKFHDAEGVPDANL